MAAFDKPPTRRQRLRSIDRQPMLQPEVVHITAELDDSPIPQYGRLRRVPPAVGQPRKGRFPSSGVSELPLRSRRSDRSEHRQKLVMLHPSKPPGQNRRRSNAIEPIAAPRLPKPAKTLALPFENDYRPSLDAQPVRRPKVNGNIQTSRKALNGKEPQKNYSSPVVPKRAPVSKQPKVQRHPYSLLVYAANLMILGIGLGVVVGTMLSIFDPARRPPAVSQSVNSPRVEFGTIASLEKAIAADENSLTPLKLSEEIAPLKTRLAALVAQNSRLKPGVFIVDLDTGAYLDWQGDESFAAASTIKIPILIAFFQDVDAGKIRLDEKLIMESKFIADGSGNMQYQKPGTRYTALETATKMIAISDNTATNMLIERLGGKEALNQRFQKWGLTATAIRNRLPDIEGTNTTTPKELAQLIARVNQGELVSLVSRDRLLAIMRQTVTNSLLPRGLGKGATIAHKTGNIGSLLADAGSIDLPSGKRYVAAVMVNRPRNSSKAQDMIREVSRMAYQYFSRPLPISKTDNLERSDDSLFPNDPLNELKKSPPATRLQPSE